MTTAKEVANWMLKKLKAEGVLPQRAAALEIMETFGEEFIYSNKNGNPAIAEEVLKEFRNLSETIAVWEQRKRFWRLRDDEVDEPGKRQRRR